MVNLSDPSEGNSGEPRDRSDELLRDPPVGEHHLGRLAGYRAGARIRRRVFGVLALCALVAAAIAWHHQSLLRRARVLPAEFEEDDRPRTIQWSSGRARLALTRDAPAATHVLLPDLELRLASGSRHAQVKLQVVEGQTTELKALVGEVEFRARSSTNGGSSAGWQLLPAGGL